MPRAGARAHCAALCSPVASACSLAEGLAPARGRPRRCTPTTAVPREALLVLQPRRDGGTPAAALVFALRAAVRTRVPLKIVAVAGPLYEMAAFEVHVVNPFPAGAAESAALARVPAGCRLCPPRGVHASSVP